ncbi:MAG: AmmeMemoRadiSam system protein B [Polyangiaceae bacterium]|nr:AmmeMemoRadiSam system protein B [Polyangiaceae bacterium]
MPSAKPTPPQTVFGPTVAGRFYTDNPKNLRTEVASYLEKGASEPAIAKDRRVVALVAPHAGYVYSGAVAGVAYAAVRSRTISTVVVLSPSHHGRRSYACALRADAYGTPIGQVPVARSLVDALIAKGDGNGGLVREDEQLFKPEHALDVQIPFILMAFPQAQIVPLIVPMLSMNKLESLGHAIFDVVGSDPNALVVASSDLSHFYGYQQAQSIDDAMVSELERDDLSTVFDKHDERRGPCGIAPIVATWAYAKKFGVGWRANRLKVRNSGDSHPDGRDRVVGYGAIALTVPDTNSKSN